MALVGKAIDVRRMIISKKARIPQVIFSYTKSLGLTVCKSEMKMKCNHHCIHTWHMLSYLSKELGWTKRFLPYTLQK